MDDDTLQHFKQQLHELASELDAITAEGDAAAQTVELDQTRQGRLSRMDALQQQAMSVASQQRRELKKQQIAAALTRIEKGEYGYCLRCDELIQAQRLEIDPVATLCVKCASQSAT